MRDVFLFEKLRIDPGVWRVDVPLVVMERCGTSHQLCTWIAIRWLRAAYQDRQDFGRREIALRGRVDEASVTGYKRKQDDRVTPGWVNELIDLGLLTDSGAVEVRGANARRCYGIPLRELEDASLAIVDSVLTEWGSVPQGAKTTEDRSALWRPSIPLAVLERCETPYLISTWLALRWLQAAFPGRTSFSSRLLAARARVNQKYLYWSRPGKPSWIEQLIELGLLTDVTEAVNGSRKRASNDQQHVTIPLKELEQESLSRVIPVLATWGINPAGSTPAISSDQLSFDFDLTDSQGAIETQHSASNDDVAGTSRLSLYEQADRMPDRPPNADDWPPLMASPAKLWEEARPNPGKHDWEQLANYAAQIDQTTGGYGWFYVGQAIQNTLTKKDILQKDSMIVLNYIWGTLVKIRKRGYSPDTQGQKDNNDYGRVEQAGARQSRTRSASNTGTTGNGVTTTGSRYKIIGGDIGSTDGDEHT